MSKMAELSMQIEELVEQGMTPKFIAVSLKIPLEWAEQAVYDREMLELEKQNVMMSYGDE
jgi:hypothetical protein